MTTNIISNTPLSERNEWCTPHEVFAWARSIVGGRFDFDTACRAKNALSTPVWAPNFFDEARSYGDALAAPWTGVVWCNPPYDDITPWVEKAIASDAITALLIPSPNGEARYGKLIQHSHEIVILGRLAFVNAEGVPISGNTRGSSLFIVNGYGQGSRSTVSRDWILKKFAA